VTTLFNHTNGSPHHFIFNEQQKPCPQWKNRNEFNSLITGIIGNKNNKRGGVQERRRYAKIVQGMHRLSILEIGRVPSFLNSSWGTLDFENVGSLVLPPHKFQVPLFNT
jgi:hypothetical protein